MAGRISVSAVQPVGLWRKWTVLLVGGGTADGAAFPPETFLGALQGCGSGFLPFRYLRASYGALDAGCYTELVAFRCS